MKTTLFALFCCTSLTAAQFEHQITIAPSEASETNKQEYVAEIKVLKTEANEAPSVVATPKLVCKKGEKAELKVESAENGDVLAISVFVPENDLNEAETTIYYTENGIVVLSKEEVVKISQ